MKNILMNHVDVLYNWLNNNQHLGKVYELEDNKKDLSLFEHLSKIELIDIECLLTSFNVNVNYILEFGTINNQTSLDRNYDVYNSLKEISYLTNNYSFKDLELNEVHLLIKTNSMLVVLCSISLIENDIDSLMDDECKLLNKPSPHTYYRGQCDYRYGLLPSIYRGKTDSNLSFKYMDLFDCYNDANLVIKYSKVFDYTEIDYRFCAYAQHSREYSPLLDFTSSFMVALSFATTNSGISISNYFNNDAALYEIATKESCMIVKESDTENIIRDIDVFVLNRKINMLTIVRDTPLFCCTYKDFETKVYLIDIGPTNDRMKYQKGCFLFFQKCVIIKGIIMMPISFGSITKYKISSKKKKEIYNYIINNCKEYDFEHLMDPYLFFKESPL